MAQLDYTEPQAAEVTPMMQLDALQQRHGMLSKQHAQAHQELTQALERDCLRLEKETENMRALLHRLQPHRVVDFPDKQWAVTAQYGG